MQSKLMSCFIFLFLLVSCCNIGIAQSYIFNTQTEVDAFDGSITTIYGDLRIEPLEQTDPITDLSNFVNISFIGGDLEIIHADSLKNLDGLSNLSTIGSMLYIQGNDSLQNIDDLSNLTSIGNIYINLNPSLENIDGLSSINSASMLTITGNHALQNINGLSNLTSVDYSVTISNVHPIQNLESLSNLNYVGGKLTIAGNTNLQNLSGLSNITFLGNSLEIYSNTNLINCQGLSNISSIGGGLFISNNNLLQNLNCLSSIDSINGNLTIEGNSELTDLAGLSSITTINGSLYISGNDILENIDALSNVNTINGQIWIQNNDTLLDIDGFANLNSLGGEIRITNNEVLLNLDGLSSLTSVNESLIIGDNYNLQNIDGLSNITLVGVSVLIFTNTALKDLNGLSSLSSVTRINISYNDSLLNLDGLSNLISVHEDLIVEDNNILSNCCGIQNILLLPNAVGGEVEISGNPSECSSEIQILENCSRSSLSGCMYWDENQNGIKDTLEKNISTIKSAILPKDLVSFPNSDGCFIHHLDSGTYILNYIPIPEWELSSDSIEYNFSLVIDEHLAGFDFGFIPTVDTILGSVHIDGGIPRCNRDVKFDFTFRNEGTTILNGFLWGQIWDEWVELTEYIESPDTIDISADGIRWGWYFEDLYPSEVFRGSVLLTMPGVDTEGFELGQSYLATSMVEANSQNGQVEYYNYQLQEEIRCAYDPNDKLVSPNREGDENYTLFEEDLTYTIRFQNTGNDTAFTVIVRDTLDNNLDVSTFRIIASSHQNILRTEIKENKYVTFTFDNILLPDSTTNFEGSQGYIAYNIAANEDIDENTLIENTASIYFDFNPPIVTNTTENTMVSCLPYESTTVEVSIFEGETYLLPDGSEVSQAGEYITPVFDEDYCEEIVITTILEVLTSTNNLLWENLVKISPNPTSSQFLLEIAANSNIQHELQIKNILGQTVHTQSINSNLTTIAINHLVPATYFVQLFDKEGKLMAVQKLVVMK